MNLVMRNFVIGAITLLVILVSISFFYDSIRELMPFFKSYDDLLESEQNQIIAKFDKFTENLRNCSIIDDNYCICQDIWPDYSTVFNPKFKDNIKIKVQNENKKADITAFFIKHEIKKAKIEKPVFYSSIFVNEIEPRTPGEQEFLINFKKRVPQISRVFIKRIIRGTIELINFVIKTDSLFFVVNTYEAEQEDWLKSLPICLPERQKAITQFDKIINDIENIKNEEGEEYEIILPENYRIFYGDKIIVLKYDKENVIRYNENTKKSERVQVLFGFDVKCEDAAEGESVSSGSKIKVRKIEERFCIENL